MCTVDGSVGIVSGSSGAESDTDDYAGVASGTTGSSFVMWSVLGVIKGKVVSKGTVTVRVVGAVVVTG